MSSLIYLDNAATTPVTEGVLNEMLPYFCELYGNPSMGELYDFADKSKQALALARYRVAMAIGCDEGEVFFTASGTEADNWAIKGTAHRLSKKGKKHLITSVTEHHAVLHSMAALERDGFEVTYLPVNSDGLISLTDLEKSIRPDTALVSIMFANNEIGTIQPIAKIGEICKKHEVTFHTDAVQAVGAVKINVKSQNIDMLSLSAHKFNGPKGVGALYVRKGVAIDNFIDGGGQERNRRAGTENVAGIVGLGKAIELAVGNMAKKSAHVEKLRDMTIAHIKQMPKAVINGILGEQRLPNNVNACFEAAEGESLLMFLNMKGICASSGSACTSGSLDPSHVLLAIGLPHETAQCCLRITFGAQNTEDEVKLLCEALDFAASKTRERSPLWNE